MRFTFLSLDFGLLLLVLVALLQGATAQPKEKCKLNNCMTPDKCESPTRGIGGCEKRGEICCSVVKDEFRTVCDHHGGICMDKCSEVLTRKSIDCEKPQKCCVLVQ